MRTGYAHGEPGRFTILKIGNDKMKFEKSNLKGGRICKKISL